MTLPPGSRLGPYDIVAPLGAGGMGEVYSARDTRLGRTVAIKILAEAHGPRDAAHRRFETEARAIASVNHPHICALFDIGRDGDVAYMVMEHLEGETLAARLSKGPLPIADALRCAMQIADALDQAHRRGIVHRDLKPANVMLTRGGAKVLDFGVAQLREPAAGGPGDLDATRTAARDIVGTPQYMAPEQAEARAVDARTDVFAFGSLLYEMLSGRKAFTGDTPAAVMHAIAAGTAPPPIDQVPGSLNRVLRDCFARDPDERWQSMGDLRRVLADVADQPVASGAAASTSIGRREWIAWGAAAIFGTAAGFTLLRRPSREMSLSPLVRLDVVAPAGMAMNFFQTMPALSPDGQTLVFSALVEGRLSLWLRRLDSLELRELPDTNGGGGVFWSPDGRSLGFFADGKLMRMPLSGGARHPLCDSPLGSGGVWTPSGTIVFQKGFSGTLHEIPADGGAATPVPALQSLPQGAHRFPSLLPDGKTILFALGGGPSGAEGTYAFRLGDGAPRLVMAQPSKVGYALGHLFFGQDARVMAQPFDVSTLALQGDPIEVTTAWMFQRLVFFDVAPSGVIAAYDEEVVTAQPTWFDRVGRSLRTVGPAGPFIHLDLAKDEQHVLLERYEHGRGELWTLDVARNVPTRLTRGPGWAFMGIWGPDAARIMYTETVGDTLAVFERDAVGGGRETQVLKLAQMGPATVTDWSDDGKYLVLTGDALPGTAGFWLLPLTGDRKPLPYMQTPGMAGQGRVSPDGRWLAYVSFESNTPEIYVASFPAGDAKWRISAAGGIQPKWRRDGRELFYLAPDGTIMAVSMPTTPDRAGVPAPLFKTEAIRFFGGGRYDYAPSKDGQRFLVNTRVGAPRPTSISIIVGWPGRAST